MASKQADAYQSVLDQVLDWSHGQDYRGYNKHDGLNSPLLSALFGWNKWTRLAAIQVVMRAPLNPRPALLIPKTRNPKGLALFLQAYLDRYRYGGQAKDLDRARYITSLLVQDGSGGNWSGTAWGYHYPWQDPGFFSPSRTPNAVVTAFVCEAFLDAYRVSGDDYYLGLVGDSIPFFQNDLPVLKQSEEEMCLAYMPLPMHMRVMDVSILVGSVFAQFARLTNDDALLRQASRLVRYVVNRQTEYGAWYYTDPPSDSLITHDNYHTGFILDSLWNYMEAARDGQWREAYYTGLGFYHDRLFTADGAPKWMHDRVYPHDIHGAAQGILTFSRHEQEYPGMAGMILDWAIGNMYAGDGRFYYQARRHYVKKFTLLRWCNAWMSRAMARYLRTGGQARNGMAREPDGNP